MEIKTVWHRASDRKLFDDEVNKLLEYGWKLGRIELHSSRCEKRNSMLFALLFKQ